MRFFPFFRKKVIDTTVEFHYPGPKEVDVSETFYFSPGLFHNHEIYSKDLAKIGFALAVTSFSLRGAKMYDGPVNAFPMFEKLGFKDVVGSDDYAIKPTTTTIGAVFAHKKMKIGGKKAELVLIGIRGGNYGAEWGGNFKVGTFGPHEGFDQAAEVVLSEFRSYLVNHRIKKRLVVFIAGYSRGGGVSNLLAAKLGDMCPCAFKKCSLQEEDIYAYTFATPNAAEVKDKQYPYIHNIINPSDFIPEFPFPSLGLTRHGQDHVLPIPVDEAAFKRKKFNFLHILSAKKRIQDDENGTDQRSFKDELVAALNKTATRDDYCKYLESGLVRIGSLVDPTLPNPYSIVMDVCMGTIKGVIAEYGMVSLLAKTLSQKTDWQAIFLPFVKNKCKQYGIDDDTVADIAHTVSSLFIIFKPVWKDILSIGPSFSDKNNLALMFGAHSATIYMDLLWNE